MEASKRNAVAAAACVLVLLAVGAEAQAAGGECVPQLNRLLACRAYAVPGAGDPSAECCSALSSISQGCACSAMSIMNSLPSRCHLGQRPKTRRRIKVSMHRWNAWNKNNQGVDEAVVVFVSRLVKSSDYTPAAVDVDE
ncbi:hypothetical protein E2562_007153 [Oryza meyeriana var. granulata]|uniref:Bifunctional inhibitor/plant lipid transfer protein/seed storage helical domain-containing protein n=1 Tax=Oryza meyeriana var. granulata TaxID=110450 RepID=A0A6G1CDS9_9ORYZ|nr:hypothetical protein E2562_007153 [Oryza meyeriana var. granulata]